jgi:hypothetical protein
VPWRVSSTSPRRRSCYVPTRPETTWRLRSLTPAGADVICAGHNALGAGSACMRADPTYSTACRRRSVSTGAAHLVVTGRPSRVRIQLSGQRLRIGGGERRRGRQARSPSERVPHGCEHAPRSTEETDDRSRRTPSAQGHRARGRGARRGRHAIRIAARRARGRSARRGPQHRRNRARHHRPTPNSSWPAGPLGSSTQTSHGAPRCTQAASPAPCARLRSRAPVSGASSSRSPTNSCASSGRPQPSAPTRRKSPTRAQRCSPRLAFRSTATTPEPRDARSGETKEVSTHHRCDPASPRRSGSPRRCCHHARKGRAPTRPPHKL